MNTPTTAAPTVRKKTTTKETTPLIPTTTSPSMPRTRIPEIIDTDDYEFSVIVRTNVSGKARSNSVEKGRETADVERKKVEDMEDGEEGSTPNVLMYTPGYDYVVEDTATEEEEGGIIDLDLTSPTSGTNPLSSTTSTLPIMPTLKTYPPTVFITKAPSATTYSTTHIRTETWAKITHRLLDQHTTLHISPYRPLTQKVPVTTPMHKSPSGPSNTGFRTTQAAGKLFTTPASPQPTVKNGKIKKPAATPKKNISASHTKKPSPRSKSSHAKGQKAQNSVRSSASDQSNLMTRAPVSVDMFWVVGNWSEVCADIL